MRRLTIGLAAVFVLVGGSQVNAAIPADTVASGVFTGGRGSLEASATFETGAPGTLQLTLESTSPADVLFPTDVLTAVFFDVLGDPALLPTSAVLGPGSSVLFGSSADPAPEGIVGGEWAYSSGLSGAPFNAKQGISSTGLDLFGPHDLFPGPNLQGPRSPDGLQYGITSGGDNPSTGNTPVTGRNALIKNSVVFALEGLPAEFKLNDISNVSFQYGTSLNALPEPSSLVVWALLLVLGITAGWRRRRGLGRPFRPG